VVTVPGSFAWDDIGSWSSVRDEMPRREGQACGPGVAVDAIEAQGNVVVGAGRVALIGVQDLAIVAGPEGLLVARLSQDQLVKQAVKKQPAAKRSDERVPSQDREIEAVFIVPPEVGPETGFLLVYHGFGESRLQHIATMERWAVRYNLVCIAPEYRDSGFDAYPSGKGARQPYDYSHLQLMDGLNAYRAARLACPQADGRRAFVWGGAQGGHLALLSAELAAGTFALCVALSNALGPSGSSFDAAGRAIRDPRAWAARLRCPVVLAHGTADPEVSVAITCGIARSLAEAGKDFSVRFVPGGDHRLGPACSWEELTEELADHLFRTAAREGPDDFEAQRRYEFPCPEGVVYRLEFAGGLACLRVVPPSQNSGGAR
jgi:dienelactone hydrolase